MTTAAAIASGATSSTTTPASRIRCSAVGALGDQLLGGGAGVERAPAGALRRSRGAEQRLVAQRDDEREVARGAAREMGEQRTRRARVDDVGEEHEERALALARGERAERRGVVRLDERRLHGHERRPERLQRGAPALRRHERAQLIVEHHRADAIAGRAGDVGEHERAGERVLEARELAGELRHRTSRIDEQIDRLRLLDRVLPRDRPPAARRRLPVDVARIVADDVVAQVGEGAPFPAARRAAHADRRETLMHREPAEASHAGERWRDEHAVVALVAQRARDEAERAAHAQGDVAERGLAARDAGHAAHQLEGAACVEPTLRRRRHRRRGASPEGRRGATTPSGRPHADVTR